MSGEEVSSIFDVIENRRSIRKYKLDPIPDEIVTKLIEAARWAPSTDNAQPWRFIIICDRNTIDELGKISGTGCFTRIRIQQFMTGELKKRFQDVPEEKKAQVFRKLTGGFMSGYLGGAPLVIVVCGDKVTPCSMVADCCAAIENMLLAIQALGLGATWTAAVTGDPRDEARTKKLLGIPEEWKVITAISVGYPAESPGPRPRKPMEEIVFYEKWGQRK